MSTTRERMASRSTGVATEVGVDREPPRHGRPRGTLVAAAALVVGAVSAGVFALTGPEDAPTDVLTPPAQRETAVLEEPYLIASGTLPDRPVQSVQDFSVPFTFSTPPQESEGRPWRYRVADLFDMGNIESGMIVLAPTETYDPDKPWKGQSELVPAPTDGAGWAQWLEQTGQVEVTERRELLIGGALATRFTLDVGELPAGYEGCGGGRDCVALLPVVDPEVGSARIGVGAQEGIADDTAQLTVIELEDRAVLVLAGGDPDTTTEWLPTLEAVIDSLRFA